MAGLHSLVAEDDVEGLPRRYATYPEEFTMLNRMSTVGAFVLASGMFLSLYNLAKSILGRGGPKAPPNPWGSATLEWFSTSPPHHHNFHEAPPVTGPYNFDVLQEVGEEAGWVRRDGRNVEGQ